MSDTPKADRVETAATGIEEDVVSLTERLRQKGDGDPIEHDLRLLEALLFAASEPLMELGWARLRGRRRTPGRPVTYGTTDGFLAHFNLEKISDLPGREDLKAAGLLDPRLPKDFEMPTPMEMDDLRIDEDPLVDEEQPEFFEDFMGDEQDG